MAYEKGVEWASLQTTRPPLLSFEAMRLSTFVRRQKGGDFRSYHVWGRTMFGVKKRVMQYERVRQYEARSGTSKVKATL